MKRVDLIKLIEGMGFSYSHTNGSHMIYKHPMGARTIGICNNAKNKDFGPAGVKQVLKEARLSIELGKQLINKRTA
jgi:predicted RNA binding protein YcfA (HicA-like mRNA interferase family)